MSNMPINPSDSDPSINPFPISGSTPSGDASLPPPANSSVVDAGMDLVCVLGDMINENLGGGQNTSVNPLEANVLAQAVLNFNNAYTSQYGAPPSSGSSSNWAQQMEYDITQPPGNSLLSLAQAGNTSGIIAFCQSNSQAMLSDTMSLRQQMAQQSGPLPGTIQAPASLSTDVLNLINAIGQAAPTSSQGLNGVATAINNIVTGLDAMGSPLDPAEQILLWTLTLPTDPSDPSSSLENAAQAALEGNPAELTAVLNQMAGGGAGSEAQWVNMAAQNFYNEQLPYTM
ncbi:MAG: hypothetical protein K2P51_08115 [Rhabdochlamydiaceae bacterium]|nr:hypothetical protein [Rhabdochlamydiaceae bacterium]